MARVLECYSESMPCQVTQVESLIEDLRRDYTVSGGWLRDTVRDLAGAILVCEYGGHRVVSGVLADRAQIQDSWQIQY